MNLAAYRRLSKSSKLFFLSAFMRCPLTPLCLVSLVSILLNPQDEGFMWAHIFELLQLTVDYLERWDTFASTFEIFINLGTQNILGDAFLFQIQSYLS